ncbi:MAG: asparagine synthase C-terminal domain-containing protein, partial [Chloroflexota bacterium]
LAYSSLVATHCQTQHRVLTFSGKQIAQHMAEAVAKLDCPVGDPLTVPNLLLSRAAARDGLRVILNGEGGDPCFGGPKNIPMLMYEWHRQNAEPVDRATAYLRSYRKCYQSLPQLLSLAVQDALQSAPPLERLVQPFLESKRMSHYLNRLYYANVRTKGAHHILPKVERLTASCGLTGQSPLFHRPIVEASFAIPPQFKLAGVEEKWVLKKASDDLLPPTIVYRPKSGMRVPVQHWLDGPLHHLVQDVLFGAKARARGLFQEQTLRTWLRGEGLLWHQHGANLWLVLTLELWLQAYFD